MRIAGLQLETLLGKCILFPQNYWWSRWHFFRNCHKQLKRTVCYNLIHINTYMYNPLNYSMIIIKSILHPSRGSQRSYESELDAPGVVAQTPPRPLPPRIARHMPLSLHCAAGSSVSFILVVSFIG